jgi:hypothetical protein
MTNSTQQRGIHMGMVTFAQGNKTPTGDGFYPGMDRTGQIATDPVSGDYSATTDGTDPGYRYAIMLNGYYFTPDYAIAPPDAGTITPAAMGSSVTSRNYSYAMLEIGPGQGRQREWKDTINSSAVVISDRNLGTPGNASSIWTNSPGDWTGTVTTNDGSATFVKYEDFATGRLLPIFENSRYGGGPVFAADDLFRDQTGEGQPRLSPNPSGYDALMIVGP